MQEGDRDEEAEGRMQMKRLRKEKEIQREWRTSDGYSFQEEGEGNDKKKGKENPRVNGSLERVKEVINTVRLKCMVKKGNRERETSEQEENTE